MLYLREGSASTSFTAYSGEEMIHALNFRLNVLHRTYVSLSVGICFPLLMAWYNTPHDLTKFTPTWAFLVSQAVKNYEVQHLTVACLFTLGFSNGTEFTLDLALSNNIFGPRCLPGLLHSTR